MVRFCFDWLPFMLESVFLVLHLVRDNIDTHNHVTSVSTELLTRSLARSFPTPYDSCIFIIRSSKNRIIAFPSARSRSYSFTLCTYMVVASGKRKYQHPNWDSTQPYPYTHTICQRMFSNSFILCDDDDDSERWLKTTATTSMYYVCASGWHCVKACIRSPRWSKNFSYTIGILDWLLLFFL